MTPEALIDELIEAAHNIGYWTSSNIRCEPEKAALASRRLHAIEVVSGLLEACKLFVAEFERERRFRDQNAVANWRHAWAAAKDAIAKAEGAE